MVLTRLVILAKDPQVGQGIQDAPGRVPFSRVPRSDSLDNLSCRVGALAAILQRAAKIVQH
jgi:hypothetical protein